MMHVKTSFYLKWVVISSCLSYFFYFELYHIASKTLYYISQEVKRRSDHIYYEPVLWIRILDQFREKVQIQMHNTVTLS